jgi:dihydrofolate reductase
MGKVISSINVTADGFCGHIDAIADEEHHQFATDLLERADILLLGRLTYQIFESFWPIAARDNTLPRPLFELAQLLDKKRKVVASKTLARVEWNNSTLLRNLCFETITRLKELDQTVLIFGSPGLLSYMTEQGLIDVYYFTVQPIIAGKGKHLFEELALGQRVNLRHLATKQSASGLVTISYDKTN